MLPKTVNSFIAIEYVFIVSKMLPSRAEKNKEKGHKRNEIFSFPGARAERFYSPPQP